jgi:hypothetical protein
MEWADGSWSWEPCDFMCAELGFDRYQAWIHSLYQLRLILKDGMPGDVVCGPVLGFEDMPRE